MPFYQVFYESDSLSKESRKAIAAGFAEAHSKLAGAPVQAAKIAFIPSEVYPGDAQDSTPIIRIVGLIKQGRDADTRAILLAGLRGVVETHAKGLGVEITLIENRPEDVVRYAGPEASDQVKKWAAAIPGVVLEKV